MDFITIIAVAVLTEAMIEYAKTIGKTFEEKNYKTFGAQTAGIVLGIVFAFAFGINVFPALGLTINPTGGTFITGVIISRGSNYASDLIGKLSAKK